jgi:hypothetical protein
MSLLDLVNEGGMRPEERFDATAVLPVLLRGAAIVGRAV